MAYTDAQIKAVCDQATEVLHGLTDAQNVTFPTTAIIDGMKNNLDADTIANNARKAIEDLPMYNNGTYNTIGSNMVLFNLASYMRGAVYNAIKALEDATPSTVTITSVSLNKSTTTIVAGNSETLTATVVASPNVDENKAVTWSLAVANDKVTVVGGVVTIAADAEAGSVTVVATSTKDNTKSASCVITIEAAVEPVTITSVTLNKNTTTIAKGGSETLTATVVASPDEAENKTVTWSLAVANDKVTVVDGVVTVDADAEEGEVTVVATSTKDDTKSDSCVVTITAE